MKENIQEQWSAQKTPQDFQKQIENLSLEVKKIKSNSVLSKLRRYMYCETAIGLTASVVIAMEFGQHDQAGLLLSGLAFFAFINVYFYVQFLRKADRVFLKDTKSALAEIIELLRSFIRRLKVLTLTITPPLVLMVLYAKTTFVNVDSYWDLPKPLLLIQLAMAIGLTLGGWLFLTRSIIPKTYAKWLKEFQLVYSNLLSE